MTKFSFDNKSLFKDNKRWFPVMGEIHYSRYPEPYWKEALLKMKAGGVDIVSSYVIWIHHEEIENEWDWTGQRDLRTFVERIKEAGLYMILRIGPWSHAEVRNGGFPDWLLEHCKDTVRTNNNEYFSYVEKFYKQIFEQVKGLLLKDGGPIIGVQIENEYGHCGGLSGEAGEEHMRTLTKMAKDIGFDVPLYTATGWGGAVTGGLLPVMGGYCDAPWDSRITEIEPSGNFVFTLQRNDHAIGSDFGLGEGITFDIEKFPYLTAELGGGLQVTYKRRPVATAKDIEAMSIAKLGSGCSLLGYYMYHGGTNPDGKLTSLQETTETGSFCSLPEKNYDFRAPLGEYGYANQSYRHLRRIAMFLHDYGEELAEMDTFIPKENPQNPDNFKDLRYAVRYNKKTGSFYLFVNNYQRRNEMLDHYDVSLDTLNELKLTNDCFIGNVQNGESFFVRGDGGHCVPCKFEPDRVPLCSLHGRGLYYYRNSEHLSDNNALSYSDSLNSVKVSSGKGKEFLFVSDGVIYSENLSDSVLIHLETFSRPKFKVLNYIGRITTPAGFRCSQENIFDVYEYTASLPKEVSCTPRVQNADCQKVECQIQIGDWQNDHFGILQDQVLVLHYSGTGARLFLDGKLVADDIYTGPAHEWKIGLRRFGREAKNFTLVVDALPESAKNTTYLEQWPDFKGKTELCSIDCVSLEPVYHVTFKI